MRLFIAINFDDATKRKILDLQRRLKELGSGNFSREENLHLTLVFLGETPPSRVGEIQQAMENVTASPMELTFDSVGRFRRDRGDIYWLGIAGNPELMRLQGQLSDNLRQAGFALENRRYSPHITLAREVRLAHGAGLTLDTPFTTTAGAISLMKSERIVGRLTYTEIHRFDFI